jgi:hypothetical protein|tara:strand:+ start:281 stop:466 length:186 start_codon:yes stop_codon:yes gene_type:complete
MQFEKKTRAGNLGYAIKLLIKVFLVLLLILIAVIFIERIDFPSPTKKIQKFIPNEKLKIVK